MGGVLLFILLTFLYGILKCSQMNFQSDGFYLLLERSTKNLIDKALISRWQAGSKRWVGTFWSACTALATNDQ